MKNVTVVEHPLLQRDLTILRNRTTTCGVFRQKMTSVSVYLAYEAMRSLKVGRIRVQTPLEAAEGVVVDEDILVVPILRAGLGFVQGFVDLVPEARVAHVGMQRDEASHEPEGYYSSVPSDIERDHVFVVDPMLATGGTAIRTIAHLKEHGASRFHFVCLVAAPEGIDVLLEAHPDIDIVAGAVDRELDANAFIRPGLGDAGDRIYGTTR